MGSEDVTEDNVTETLEAAEEAGYSVGFEWRLGKWAGLEFDYLSADNEFAYGAQVGLDISLFKSVAIVTGLRYLQLDLQADDQNLAVNPLFAKAGVAFRW
jgi:hypothetical protein